MIAIVAGHGGLVPVTHARPIQPGLVVPFLLYWVVGLSGLASLNRSRLLARWKRDRSLIDDDLGERWRTASGAVVGGSGDAVLCLVVGRSAAARLAHTVAAAGLRGVTEFVGTAAGGRTSGRQSIRHPRRRPWLRRRRPHR